MSDAIVTSLAGLIGVLVGAFLGPFLASHVVERASAKHAARIAVLGLQDWVRLLSYASEAQSRLGRDEDFDVLLAVEVHGYRRLVDLKWWEDNSIALMLRASDVDVKTLNEAKGKCRYIPDEVATIGTAGLDAMRKLDQARAKRVETGHSALEDVQLSSDPEIRQAQIAARVAARQVRDDMAELHAGLAEWTAVLDHRLHLAHSAWVTLLGMESLLTRAIDVCRSIEQNSQGTFGTAEWMRRRVR